MRTPLIRNSVTVDERWPTETLIQSAPSPVADWPDTNSTARVQQNLEKYPKKLKSNENQLSTSRVPHSRLSGFLKKKSDGAERKDGRDVQENPQGNGFKNWATKTRELPLVWCLPLSARRVQLVHRRFSPKSAGTAFSSLGLRSGQKKRGNQPPHWNAAKKSRSPALPDTHVVCCTWMSMSPRQFGERPLISSHAARRHHYIGDPTNAPLHAKQISFQTNPPRL